MPESLVVAGILEAAAYEFSGSLVLTTFGSALVSVGGLALSYGISQALSPNAKAKDASLQAQGVGQLQSRFGPTEPWQMVYGKVRKGGTYIFRHVTDFGNALHTENHVVPVSPPYAVTLDASAAWTNNNSVSVPRESPTEDGFEIVYDAVSAALYTAAFGVYTFDSSMAGKDVRIIFMQSDGHIFARYRHDVLVLACHQCEAIDEIWIDDKIVTLGADGHGTGVWAGRIYVAKHLGAPGQAADSTLMGWSQGKWTAAHDVAGFCYLYVQLLKADWDNWLLSDPNITVVMRGKNNIYDPRADTFGYSANPALCTADYLASPFGMGGIFADEFSSGNIMSGANACDESVAIAAGGVENRYSLNGVVSLAWAPKEIISRMKSSMAGDVVRTGGKWKIYPGVYRPHTITLSQSDFVGPVKTATLLGKRDSYNGVKGTFFSPANNWQLSDFPAIKSNTFMAADGGERIWKDVEYPFTTSASMAQRIAKIDLLSGRQQLAMTASVKLGAMREAPPGAIGVTLPHFGYANKAFRINEMTLNVDRLAISIDLALRETDSSIYDWGTGEEQAIDPAPDTNFPDPFLVLAPASIDVVQEIYRNFGGDAKVRALVTWAPAPDATAVDYTLQWQRRADGVWFEQSRLRALTAEVLNITEGDYLFRVRAINGLGVNSLWTQVAVSLSGLGAAPANVAGFSYAIDALGPVLKWIAVADRDQIDYEIRRGASWEAGTDVVRVDGTSYRIAPLAAGSATYWIAARGSFAYSGAPAALTLASSAPLAPAVTAAVVGENVELSGAAPGALYKIDHYELRHGATFAGGVLINNAAGSPFGAASGFRFVLHADFSATRQFFVAAVDVAGNVGAAGGASVTVAPPGAPHLTAQVIDNTVMLFWDDERRTLPLLTSRVFRDGAPIGEKNGLFTTDIRQQQGNYTYSVIEVDTAGNEGAPGMVTAVVSAPPDYVFRDDYDSNFGGTLSSALLESGALFLPLPASETWEQHFALRGWNSPNDQINAGYPLYLQPAASSGYYEELIDYGAMVPGTTIKVTVTSQDISGAPDILTDIATSADGSTWENNVNVNEIFASGFRYVLFRVHIASGGIDIAKISRINVKLFTRRRHDTGSVASVNSSGAMNRVYFDLPFLSVTNISVNAINTSSLVIPVISLPSGPNPTYFDFEFHNSSSGTRVGGFSAGWTADGY